ncbi:L-aspartate oxidase [Halobacillus seohaensis]|uniref:L-aspartate oxidase n=1 Tax=Halobacillus seohaensis TaxID=447421 RepID=A0ABW2ENX8_9BACI
MNKVDVIIVGSGIAALQLAVHLPRHLHVIIITKSHKRKSNSSLAQGGVAAAVSADDHTFSHYLDTLEAGRHLNNRQAVYDLTHEAPAIIQELIDDHCLFDRDEDGNLQLGKEGAHRFSRIIHGGGDQTGRTIVQYLLKKLGRNVQMLEDQSVYELLVNENGHCYGVKSKTKNDQSRITVAPHVVLSTGGCGQLYSLTSNSEAATGDGISLAYWAGAKVVDMEFVQFHPTLLFTNGETKGLVSEAVRGQGARIVDEQGNYFMDGVHPMGDLGPRHIVAQTIFERLESGKSVYLDISTIKDFEGEFPTVTALCHRNGVFGKIPVAPGSHFLMGGVKTDDLGSTNVPGLYAIGEVACTGVHGANRLASNSLLEGLVYGKRLATFIAKEPASILDHAHRSSDYEALPNISLPTKKEIQSHMMKRVGIVRDEESLQVQREWIESFELDKWIRADFSQLTKQQWSIVSMLQTCWLITNAALTRTESRGGHFRSDFPCENDTWQVKQTTQTLEMRRSYQSIKA